MFHLNRGCYSKQNPIWTTVVTVTRSSSEPQLSQWPGPHLSHSGHRDCILIWATVVTMTRSPSEPQLSQWQCPIWATFVIVTRFLSEPWLPPWPVPLLSYSCHSNKVPIWVTSVTRTTLTYSVCSFWTLQTTDKKYVERHNVGKTNWYTGIKEVHILNMYRLLSYNYLLNNSAYYLFLRNIGILSGIVSRHDLKSLKKIIQIYMLYTSVWPLV